MTSRGLAAIFLCLAACACAGPPRLSLDEQLAENDFNRAFGLPGDTPTPGAFKRPPAIPATLVEVIPRRPRGAVMWQPSSWEWTGRQYVWVKGLFLPAVPDVSFEPGHWQADIAPGYYVWARGAWK
jgi:hypothetical protein